MVNCIEKKIITYTYNEHSRKSNDIPKWGEIRWAYLPSLGNKTHIQSGLRPVMIISNNKNNMAIGGNVHIIPFTSRIKKIIPTHIPFKAEECGLKRDSILLAECERQIPNCYVYEKIGKMPEYKRLDVINAILIQHGLFTIIRDISENIKK